MEVRSVQELKLLMKAAAAALKAASNPEASLSPAAEDIVAEFQNLSAEQKGEIPSNGSRNGLVLRTNSAEALHVLDVVKRACGPASKDVLQLLTPVLATLTNGSIQASRTRAWNIIPIACSNITSTKYETSAPDLTVASPAVSLSP